MAIFKDRVPENVPGRFYVDNYCLDCDVCRDTAPANFARVDEHGVSYIKKQPENAVEEAACQEALEACCVEAIGNDGENHDWAAIPPYDREAAQASYQEYVNSIDEEETKNKKWWKFW